jgi:hypothetical protein
MPQGQNHIEKSSRLLGMGNLHSHMSASAMSVGVVPDIVPGFNEQRKVARRQKSTEGAG